MMTLEEIEKKAEELASQLRYDNIVYGRSGIIVENDNTVRVATQEELENAINENQNQI